MTGAHTRDTVRQITAEMFSPTGKATTSHTLLPWDPLTHIPDLTGKVAIVTGANLPTGIGFHIAHNLALKGAKTYVSARSLRRAREGIEMMYERRPELRGSGLLLAMPIELSDLVEVKRAGREFVTWEERLDVLVNCAALVPRDLDCTEHGVSLSFTVNHLAPFVLTNELLPLLKRTAQVNPGVRVVNVSSEAHMLIPNTIRLRSLEDFNQELESPIARYGLSKLANILFAKELQRRFDVEGIAGISISLHPGNSRTDGSTKFLQSVGKLDMLEGLATPEEAALTALFAATDPIVWKEKEKYGGAYLVPFGILKNPSEAARNDALAKELWEASEWVVKDVLGD